MKVSSYNLRKICFNLFLAVAMMFSAILCVMTHMSSAYAYTYVNSGVVVLNNADFNQYTTGENGSPYSLENKNWVVTTSGGVVGGVIDTTSSTFESNNKFGLASNPNVDESIKDADKYVLMFRTSTYGVGRATSETITLTNGSYFDVSIRAKNAENGQGYIVFNLDSTDYSLPVVASEWNTYHLLVATDVYNSSSLNLSLYLNKNSAESKGATFFDHICIDEISEVDFYSSSSSYYVSKADLTTARAEYSVANFTNSDFSAGMNGWTNASVVSSGDYAVGVYSLSNINSLIAEKFNEAASNYADSYRFNNLYSLLLLNKDNVTTKVESSEDNLLTIPQHSYYRLTLIAKTGHLSASNFKATLTPTNEDISNLTITQSDMSSSIDNMNGFSTMSFLIKGSYLKDEALSLSMSLESASGYVIIDSIELYPITMSEYTNSTSTSNKLDLSTDYSIEMQNGRFDFSNNDNIEVKYPLLPADWTFGGTTNESGIIRINPSKFNIDAQNYGNPSNPGLDTATYDSISNSEYYNENVLMLRNRSHEEIYYASTENTLTSKVSTAKFAIDVKTLDNAIAFVRLVDSDGNIVASIEDINTNNEWKTVSLYVKNGISSLSLKMLVGMKGNGTNQYVFYDCAVYKTEEYVEGEYSVYVNLLKNGFTSKTSKVVENTSTLKIYEINGFSVYSSVNSADAVYGVVDVKENSSLKTYSDAEDGYLLAINNAVDNYTIISSDYTYSLSGNSYYEISVYVKTDFSSATSNGETYGAYIELVGLNDNGEIVLDEENTNKFDNIVTSTTDNNGFVKYSLYVLSEKEQKVKILLGLGKEDSLTEGTVYFDDLNVTDITEAEYAEQQASSTTLVSKVIEVPTTDNNNEDTTTKEKEDSGVNVFALMSSILLILALIFAIAGVLIRKRNEDKPAKPKKIKDKPEYHKTPKEIDKRNISKDLSEMREESLADLRKRRDSLQEDLDNLTSNYEAETKDDEVINQVKYKEYIKNANKLREEKEYLDSAIAYLNSDSNAKVAERKEIRKRQRKAKKELEEAQNKIDNK